MDQYIAQGKALGLEGTELRAFVEAERNQQRLADEREDSRRQCEREVDLRASERASAERDREERREEAARTHELELRRLELSARPEGGDSRRPSDAGSGRDDMGGQMHGMGGNPRLHEFKDGTDDMDNFLTRFERQCELHNWSDRVRAIQLSNLLTGRALEAYTQLPADEATDYDCLKAALLARYQLNAASFEKKFTNAKFEVGELPRQFILRIEGYWNRWFEASNIQRTFDALRDEIIRARYLDSISPELVVYLKEQRCDSLGDLATKSAHFIEAHGHAKALKDGGRVAQGTKPKFQGAESNHKQTDPGQGRDLANSRRDDPPKGNQRCFTCQGNHLAKNCQNKGQQGNPKPVTSGGQKGQSEFRNFGPCPHCGKSNHSADRCYKNPNRTSQPQPTLQKAALAVENPILGQELPFPDYILKALGEAVHKLAATEASDVVPQPQPGEEDDFILLHCRPHKRRNCEECMLPRQPGNSVAIRDHVALSQDEYRNGTIAVYEGKLYGQTVQCVRDTGASTVIVRRDLVPESDLTGETSFVELADGTVRQVEVCQINIDCPFYTGRTRAICFKRPVYDLLIGNIVGATSAPRESVSKPPPTLTQQETVNSGDVQVAAAITRSQARAAKENKPSTPLIVADIKAITSVSLKAEQQIDPALQKHWEMAKNKTMERSTGNSAVSYEIKKGLLYRNYTAHNFNHGQPIRQIMVPAKFKAQVMDVAHRSVFSGHLGRKATEDRIIHSFYWPGLFGDIARYCRACDACQRTKPSSRIGKIPLGRVPVMDIPFKRVAIDLIGPVNRSTKGNAYILTLVDIATRYL